LTRATQEKQVAASVFPAGAALVAGAAGQGRIDRHEITRSQVSNMISGFQYDRRALVTDNEGEFDHLLSDTSVPVIMEIRTADADRGHPYFDVIHARRGGGGPIDDFDTPFPV
jgi:hypothetical protein